MGHVDKVSIVLVSFFFFFDNLIQAEVVLKEGNTTEKMSPLGYPGARL